MLRTASRDTHVHLWEAADEIARHVDFRDWLRAHEDDRLLYERTKRELARTIWTDANEYAEAKSAVVADISRRMNGRSSP